MEYNKKTYSKPYTKKVATAKVEYKPKRGKLAPLMSEDEKASAGIHELSYDFEQGFKFEDSFFTMATRVPNGQRMTKWQILYIKIVKNERKSKIDSFN